MSTDSQPASRTYEAGYHDGDRDGYADWERALGEVLPADVDVTPSGVAAYLRQFGEQLRDVAVVAGRVAQVRAVTEFDTQDRMAELLYRDAVRSGDVAAVDAAAVAWRRARSQVRIAQFAAGQVMDEPAPTRAARMAAFGDGPAQVVSGPGEV